MAVPVAGRGPQVVGVYSLFIALTTITVILRVYCRALIVKKIGLDDWLAVVGWVTFVVFSAFAITGTHHGTGQHAVDIIPPTEIPVGIMYWWLCEPVYVVSNMFIKGSIAVMLLRLTIIRSHRIIIWTTIVITELYSGFFFFLFIFQCRPSSYFWTQYTGGSGTCINPNITVYAVYAYSAITCAGDWIFAILPYFLVWKLQMNWRSKTVVAVILSLGAIASTATIIRIPYVHTLTDVADFLYATTDVAIWSCVETGLGISASCLATLRPLFRSLLANTSFGSSQAQRHTGSGMPGAGTGSRANGYARTHSRGASRGLEELNLGIRKTTRVSVDEFRHWDNGTNYAETDQDSAKSETSKTRITSSDTTPVDGNVCPWDSTEGKVVGSAWAEGKGRR